MEVLCVPVLLSALLLWLLTKSNAKNEYEESRVPRKITHEGHVYRLEE